MMRKPRTSSFWSGVFAGRVRDTDNYCHGSLVDHSAPEDDFDDDVVNSPAPTIHYGKDERGEVRTPEGISAKLASSTAEKSATGEYRNR
jgi:hypothetical protein